MKDQFHAVGALDEANTAIADHKKSASSLASATSMVESSGERFIELQKGINTATGESKSLTEAEYQEYAIGQWRERCTNHPVGSRRACCTQSILLRWI